MAYTRVVIVGGGFGGLTLAKKLGGAKLDEIGRASCRERV